MIGGAPLTAEAQDTMGRYGGWGAADGVFAPGASGNDLRDRERLRAVMTRLGGSEQAGEKLFNAAGLTTLNAHYTDPLLVRAMYRALRDLGLEQGNIAEAGVGAGQFAAFAPDGIRITGIELDPATALIAQLLHPKAEILVGSVSGPRFARVRDQSANPVRVPRDTADGFAGNVPFSEIKWPDEVLNPGQKFPLHDHAILWGVTRVAPGGLCAFITSRYTADKPNPGFRRTLAAEMDLIGMVRLPSTAHKRMAGTPVVTDIIIGRRLADGERPRTDPETWEQARPLPLPGSDVAPLVNTYYHANPQHVLGRLTAGGMRRADDFSIGPSGDLEQQLGAALGEITGRALAAGQRHEPRPAARPVIEILSRRPDGTVSVNPDGTFTQVVHGQDTPLEVKDPQEADKTRRLVALAEARAALITAEAACPEDNDEIDALRARMGRLYDEYTGKYGAIGRFTVTIKNHHVKTFKGILDRLDFSKPDVPDPEIALLEEYLGRDALTRIVKSVTDPGHVRRGTRKDKQGNQVPTATQLIRVPDVRAALTAALAKVPQGADAERLAAAFGERMSRIETSEQRTRLMPVAFRSDPRRPAVEALENFDPVTQTAVKKPVFSRRTSVPHRLELGADTPQEALDLVLIHHRRVDLAEIARLLGTDQAGARKQLGTLVFNDPAAGGRLVAAGEYLSGNVHEKLAAARTAAAGDPRYAANVESLLAIQPPALGYEDIQARLGSAWLSREIVRDGLRHILDDPTITVTHPGGAGWTVSSRKGPGAENPYGTSDWSALDMAQALLTNDSIAVYRKRLDPQTGEEKSYRDDHATLYNYRRAQRLDADFVSWLWSDPDRAGQCVRLYNAAYNNQVKRKWDSSPFCIPGLAPGMRLHPFQNAMVRRLHTESGLAAWVVGAGKTELGIVAAMEGHRLGRHGLCGIVCPASLVNQWRDRIYRTYPGAGVLVADDDLRARRDALEMFVERAASRDYQLAVIPYEFFGSLSLSADAARASVDEEIDKLTRYAREAAAQGDSYTAKSLQKQIARLEAQYSAVALASGGATGFTDARITGLVIDEWHNFRRFKRDSNNREFAMDGSARGNHMLAVADHLRRRHPEGLVLGLSGTPLEQSIADAWAAMRFFAPETLKALGLEEFDAFLTTFGRTEARREPTPTGSGLHVRERASDWFNLPELRRTLWEPFADQVRSADLGLNVPRIAGGRPQTHVLAQTPGQASVQAEIDDGYARFKAGSRDPDNHILRLMDRGAKNALHPRMLGMETDGQIKLEVWADDAAAWYHASKDGRFLDREGNPHPVPGALRMVACELGVPDPARPNAWSVYAEMRSLLAARGVPAGKVRFAQDAAGSDRKKAALWEDARTGRCNFVIGSAQTAGTGVDVPDRLQVLDFMTLGWNPTQFEQWLGRIIRQGNQNPEVAVHVWSTEGTTEVLRADKIAMKSAPFEALLDGDSGTRRVTEESFSQTSAFAADMSARMSGNPLLNAQREAQLDVGTAQGMQDEWQRENGVKARRIPALNSEIQELEEQNAAIGRALGRAVDTQGDKFAAQVGTARYTVRAEAGAALIAALAATAAGDVSALADGTPQHLGELAGFPVTARYRRFEPDPPAQGEDGQGDDPAQPEPSPAERTLIALGLEGVPNGQVGMINGGDLPDRDPVALITSLEGRIRRLPGDRDKNAAAIAENRDQIAKTKAELAKPSPYLQQLADARDALDRIETQIDELIKDAAPEADAPASAGAQSVPASPGERAPDAGAEPADRAAAPSDSDIASLPPWTDTSPYSAAIGAALQAALADSDVTQVAGSNDLSRFLEWLSGAGWMNDHAAAAVGDDGQVPPFARAVLDDPVFAADLACAVGTVVHARCAGQALPPGSAALRPIPPIAEMSALRHWQEHDEAIGRAAGTDQWYDLVDAARIDIWLSRAGLPRAGRQVLVDSGGHAVLELAAADGEQWRLTIPDRKKTQQEATAPYKVTRSGRDGWAALLNGTPGSTTPEQAAALLTGTLAEEGALPPPAAPAPGHAGITPAPPDTSARHNSPQPGTVPAAPALPATGSSDDDGDARTPQPDSGLLRNLAAAHGMHCHYDSGTATAAVFRSESRAGQPVLRQGHPGGPLVNQAGRVIPGEHAGAYLAEAARFPDLNAGTLYQRVIPGAVAGEEASPRSTAHATFSISAIQARDTGRPQVVYADGDAAVASPEPPADGGAYYLATPHGQDVHWTRHMNGTAEPVSHHLRAGDLSVISGETAAAGFPAPQPADGTAVREPGEVAPASPQPSAPSPSEAPARAAGAPDAPGGPGTGQDDGGRPGSPDGTAEPGPGMTPEEPGFVHQNALGWALRGIASPSPDQHERALDYAAWYLAEFGDEDSVADLPGHDHAWNWFIDRGYPAREPASTASGPRDLGLPGAEAAAGPAGLPGHAAPEPPAGPWSAAGLRQLAGAYGLAAVTDRTGGTLTVTVHDQGRTVLLHNDLNGTVAGGRRLDPAQVAAYLAAYVRYPQLPPRCLLDLARSGPAEPAPLPLTAARELAALHGLEVRVRRTGGQSYITFCEPGTVGDFLGDIEIPREPVLSYPAGSGSARHGPCAVPVAAIGSYLAAYRESVPPAMFTAREPYNWRSRLAPLTPHLIDGGGHFMPAVRDRLRAAIAAGRDGRAAEAATLLAEAEALAPVTLLPEREAELTAAARRDAAGYPPVEDLAAASVRTLHVTARELDWVRTYLAAHPEIRDHPEDEPAAAQASDREAVVNLVTQAKGAFASGEYERALALIDETELLHPGNAAEYDRARNQVREAMRRAVPASGQHAAATGQVQAAPGFYADEATSRTAVAAIAAGLGGVHAGPRALASPAAGTPAAALPAGDGEPADGTRPGSPAVPEDPGDGEPAPGQEFDWGGADFRYELAYAFALGSNPPGSAEDERARDFAAWYMARHGGGGPGGEMPAHSFEWRRFAELGYPARAPGAEQAEAGPAALAGEPVAADVPPALTASSTSTGESAGARAAAPPEPDAAGRDADGLGQPAGTAAPASPALARPPEGTQPVAAHTAWEGELRPERLLYADGTPLAVRGQGEHCDEELSATAVGAVPAPEGEGYGTGRLQVVRYDDGRHAVVHPALASPAGTDPYSGLNDQDRARWQAFDYSESYAGRAAQLPPHLVEPGDMLYVHNGDLNPVSNRMKLHEVQSAGLGTGRNAGWFVFNFGDGITVPCLPDDYVLARRPDVHPTLAAAVRAALAAGPGQPETAPPVAGQAAADIPGTAALAPASPDQAPGPDEPGETGPYSGRVRIALESGGPVVSGTEFNDPAELRDALRDNFTWRKKRQVWEYNGRKAGPQEAAQAVRDVLVRLDRESAPAPAVKEFPPTPQQQAILDAFLDGKGIAVQALAGTGKTTTLVLLARALMDRSPEARIVYTAFNASIVADARRGRFGRNVTASTMHSLARQALLQTGYAGKIEHADKGARWPEQWAEVLGIPEGTAAGTRDGAAPADAAEVARLVIATVRKFRESADGEPGRQHLPYLAGPAGSRLSETVLSYARQAWADISSAGNAKALAAGRALRVEHDDYLKVWALSRPTINAEVIFFDEAQDVNDVMRAVVLDQPAQTVVVGDSHQSIYGFRGAIDALKDWPADIVLPLTQSWRFGPAAAEFGNLFLRSLGSKLLLEGNPALETRLGSAPEPDAILCRTNATAVAEVFAGLESGKRTALAGGGDAIKEIAKAARDLQAGRGTKHPDLSRFTDWDEVKDYAKNDEDGKSLQVFTRLIDRHGPGGLIDMIGRLTPEGDTRNPPQLTISTAHKAKGLEWDVVRVAGDFRGPATDPETGEVTWPVPEERRLAYVAATRARKLLEPGSLNWINDYPLPGARHTKGPAQGKDREAQAAAPDAPRPLRIQPDAAAHTEPEQDPAPQDSQEAAQAGHSTAGAPDPQRAPAPGRAEAPASAAAGEQAAGADEPHARQQGLAEEGQARPEPGSRAGTARQQGRTAAVTRLRALAGQHGLSVTTGRLSAMNTLITITDGDRAVLLHDDISGTKAGGIQIDFGEADAYLTARRDYPGLPARALLGWIRRGPDAPAQLSLSAAREIAENWGLTAQPVRAAGQPFIVFREPGCTAAVLACRPGSPAASSGPVTVPVPVIGRYLDAHREAIPPRWLTLFGQRDDWASQVIALAPYLIDGTSLHSTRARHHVAAAADAAARSDHGTVQTELRRAWAAAGPFVPAPDREAVLVRIIGDVAARYQQVTGDGARYVAEIAGACGPEWDWIEQWIRDHPQILTAAPPSPEAIEQRTAGERAQAAAEGKTLSTAAKAAFDTGDYPAALTLIDQGETADPDSTVRWKRARAMIVEKATATGHAPQATTAGQAAPAAAETDSPPPQQAAAAAPGPGAVSNGSGTAPGTPGTAGTQHFVPGDPPSAPGLPATAPGTPGTAGTQHSVPGDPPSAQGPPATAAPGVQAGHAASTTPATPAAGEAADGDHASSPDGADKPDAGQASPGSGLTREDLDFAYQHARRYALGASRDPDPEREERALDYATWYLAAYRDRESMADLPGHSYAWARFADQGYPAREPARTANGQRDHDQPGTGADATVAGAGGPLPADGHPHDTDPSAATAAAAAAVGGTYQPYTDLTEARRDWQLAGNAYIDLAGMSGAKRLLRSRQPASAALRAAWQAIPMPRDRSLTGSPAEVPARFDALAQAADALGASVQDSQPLRITAQLGSLSHLAAGLAGRLQATAAIPGAWRQVFGREPDPAQATAGTSSPAPAQPGTAGAPDPDGQGSAEENQPGPPPAAEPNATAPQLAADSGDKAGHAASSWPKRRRRPGRDGDALAPDRAKAAEVVAAARRSADAHVQAHVPTDYARLNAVVRRQRAALTRAVNSKDPAKVILAVQHAVSEWNQDGMAWPDDWTSWQAALNDALPGQHIDLEDLPARPAPQDRRTRAPSRARQDAAPLTPGPGQPARAGEAEPPPAPLTNSDLADALNHMPGQDFARLLTQPGTSRPQTLAWQRDDLPGDGGTARAVLDDTGIGITVTGPGIRRHSHLTWPHAGHWLENGMTPGRLGIIVTASRLHWLCQSHRSQPPASGATVPDPVLGELARIRDDAITTVISAALRTRRAAAPVPPAGPGTPASHGTAIITRPAPAAAEDENTVLERLARLRADIAEPQPVTPAEIKETIRRWIGDRLPDYVRALASPAKMRGWIGHEITTRAVQRVTTRTSRPAPVTYADPGTPASRWYSASPDGLLTGISGDDRAETLIVWEQIPAWVQPGISASLRDQLLSADGNHSVTRRQLTALMLPRANLPSPAGQEAEQAARELREAITAAWAAIEAAPPPSRAQLDDASRTYQGPGPMQRALFAWPEPAGHQDNTTRAAGHQPAAARTGPAGPVPAGAYSGTDAATQGAAAARELPAGTGRPPAITARPAQAPDARTAAPAAQPGTTQRDKAAAAGPSRPRDEVPRAGAHTVLGLAAAPAGATRPHDTAARGAGQPRPTAEPGPAAKPADMPARAGATAAAPTRQQAHGPAPASAGSMLGHHPDAPAEGARPQPGRPGIPLTDDDICSGLSRLPSLVFTDLFAVMDTGQPMNPATRLVAPYSGERAPGKPGSGARETVTASPDGLRIQVDAADGTRAGLLSWPEAARWVQPGLTGARRQVIEQATRTRLRFAMAHASFGGTGEAALAAAAEGELRSLATAAVGAMLDTARACRTGPPDPGSPPGYGDGEAAALDRIADLAAALPDQQPQPRTPIWQIQAGDIIGHPGYRLQPFLVAVSPCDRDGQIEITGRLTSPSGGQPAGQITLTLPRAGYPDPVVYLIPPPARSLRPLLGGTTATGDDGTSDPASDQNASLAEPAASAWPGQPAATPQRPHASPSAPAGTGSTTAAAGTPGTTGPGSGRLNGTTQPPGTAPPIQEDTMPPALPATPLPAQEPASAAGPGPQPARPGTGSQARPGGHGPDRPAADARLLRELDHVLAAILERRRAAAAPAGADGTSFADIHAAFAVLRSALDLPGTARNGNGARPAAAMSHPAAPAPAQHAAADGEFGDIRAAFASLRDVLGLPAASSHARPAAESPDTPAGPEATILDQAAAEAQACARWYRDTPEWQRMTRIGRAARDLLTAIREAAGDYWAEIRLDVRVRGFARTLTARVSLAVSGTAHLLAGRLERAGHQGTRAWRAAWRLHQATATFAHRVMSYTPPGSRARMDDARRIIDDLGRRPRRPGEPGPSPAAGSPGRQTRTPGAAALGRESFPVLVSRANARQAAAPAARAAAPPRPGQAQPAARP